MAKLINPRLFSQRFGINPTELDKEGLLDPVLNADTKLFVDPLLLKGSSHPVLQSAGVQAFEQRMSSIIELLVVSQGTGDAPWKAAMKLLALHERSETCLGYGGSGTSGRDRPDSLKQQILTTAKQIVDVGVRNPELIVLMGLLESGVGPDSISDLTTNAILRVLEDITGDFCNRHSVPLKKFMLEFEEYEIPENPLRAGSGIFLVPKDVLRELPVATTGGQDAETKHATQKPVECMRRPMLNNSNPGQAIYEPFLGSGTTLIAAQSCGRVCFGIEIDPLYVDLAIRRWQAFTGENATRESDGAYFEALEQASNPTETAS